MSTEDDLANCAAYGQVVNSCPITTSSSSVIVTPSSSSTSGCNAGDNTETHYCSNGLLKNYGRVTINSQSYKTVVIGSQTWIAEDLKGGMGGWGYYAAQSDGVVSSQYLCGAGWHLPDYSDWKDLIDFVEADSRCGSGCAGKKLKAMSGWDDNGNGTDDYGFSALPNGYFNEDAHIPGTTNGYQFDKGKVAVWWVDICSDATGFCNYQALTSDSDDVFSLILSPSSGGVIWSPNNVVKQGDYSLRCIKD
jgi:uncharacterized protein (TIGR02145 family)